MEDRKFWLGAVLALICLCVIPAFGQDGPPLADKTPETSASANPAPLVNVMPAASAQSSMAQTKTDQKHSKTNQKAPKAQISAAAAATAKADPPPLTGVAAECADLLSLAKALKAEVDKTTQDVLSVAVVRDAGKIQKMAHSMREGHGH